MSSFKILMGGALASALLFGLPAAVHAAPVAIEEVEGQVQDALGRPIDGASLSLKTATGAVVGHTESNTDGHLSPGKVSIRFMQIGISNE